MEFRKSLKQAYYIGIMSGSSLDGIDVALADFSSSSPSLLHTLYLPYDQSLRDQLLSLNRSENDELHRAAMLGNTLARCYAQAVSNLLHKNKLKSTDISAIGCHGQTIRHCPQLGMGYTIQLGNSALLAELTGITVVSDFRSRDIAAGGQGAPIVPIFHQMLFQNPKVHRVIVNIGGISNVTNLMPGKEVTGFDCGPGNLLMDAWCLRHTGQSYDENGKWAKLGTIIPSVLERLTTLQFFSLPPPKSTGRELFNMLWLESCLSGNERPVDVQATLLQLTITTIVKSILINFPDVMEIYLCGGGARNGELVSGLQVAFLGKKVETTDTLGINADWVEAFAFAWLSRQTILKIPSNLCSITGAKGERILGAIYHA